MEHRFVGMNSHYASPCDGREEVRAYLSRPLNSGPWAAAVVVHAYRGLDDHYRELADRLASSGIVAIAPDLYHGETAEKPEKAIRLKNSLDYEKATQEILAGVAYLRSLPYVSKRSGVLGFCMSGGLALLAAAEGETLDAAVVYYPSVYPDLQVIANVNCPVILHIGTEDTSVPTPRLEKIRETLQNNDIEFEYYEYEDVGHAFLNELGKKSEHEDVIRESWDNTLNFLRKHLAIPDK